MPSLVKFPTSFNGRLGLLGWCLDKMTKKFTKLWKKMAIYITWIPPRCGEKEHRARVKALFSKNRLPADSWWKLQICYKVSSSEVDQLGMSCIFTLIPCGIQPKWHHTPIFWFELVVNLCEEVPHFIINTRVIPGTPNNGTPLWEASHTIPIPLP